MLRVSDDVVALLRQGGRRCKNFLEQVADGQKAITCFSRHYGLKLKGIDIGTEGGKEEPFYCFSDRLGMYTIKGLRLE